MVVGEKLKPENKNSSSEFFKGEHWGGMSSEQRSCRKISARVEE